jgi:hypothetical protein
MDVRNLYEWQAVISKFKSDALIWEEKTPYWFFYLYAKGLGYIS